MIVLPILLLLLLLTFPKTTKAAITPLNFTGNYTVLTTDASGNPIITTNANGAIPRTAAENTNLYGYKRCIEQDISSQLTTSSYLNVQLFLLMQFSNEQVANGPAFQSPTWTYNSSKYKLTPVDLSVTPLEDKFFDNTSAIRKSYSTYLINYKFKIEQGTGSENCIEIGNVSTVANGQFMLFRLTQSTGEVQMYTISASLENNEQDIIIPDYTNLISQINNNLVTIASNQQTVSDNITDQLIANQVSTNTAINNQTNTIVNSITSLNGVVTNLPANINLYIATQTSSINARMDSNTDEIVTALGNIQINTTSLEDKITNLQTSLVNALQQQTQTLSGTNTQSEETDFLTQKDQFTSSINSFQYSQNSQLGSNLNSNINHITNELTSFAALIGTDVPHPSTTNRPGDFRKCRQGAFSNNTPAQFNVGSLRIPSTNTNIQIDLPCPRQFVARMFGISLTNSNVTNLYNMQSVGSWSNAYNLFKLSWAIFGFSYITIDLVKLFYKIIQPQKVITELNGL